MADVRTDQDAMAERVAAVRRFNRFYTRRIGALDAGHLQSPFSLGQARVLYEIAHWPGDGRGAPTATDLGRALGLDAGYLSRLLRDFEARGLVGRTPSPVDARQQHLRLTAAGRAAFADLDARARADVAALLAAVPEAAQARLLGAMHTVEAALGGAAPGGAHVPNEAAAGDRRFGPHRSLFHLRPPRPGDLGWVLARHGAFYAAEYGWGARFEALVARIVADYAEHHDAARERCWIAERAGDGTRAPANVGSVLLVRHPERAGVARLRLLLVEPSARGLGIGAALVGACTAFAREAGYHTITLWTNSVLAAARRLYEAEGYQLVAEEPHQHFGHGLVGQTWELAL